MKQGHAAPTKRALGGQTKPAQSPERPRQRRGAAAGQDDLVEILSVLEDSVQELDALIRSQRPLFEQADRGAELDKVEASKQWTRLRASADDIVIRAHEALEKVKQGPSD